MFRKALLCVLALSMGACANDTDGETTSESSSALLGVDEFLYLRCSGTSWGIGAENRLLPTSDPYLFQLTYDINQSWIVNQGDTCIFTLTNQLNGWGTSQTSYSARNPSTPIVVPGGQPLAASSANFSVRYPALGRYTLTVNWRQGSFNIASAAATPSCTDGIRNGNESDIDCGGSCTAKCANGKACSVNADCQSSLCSQSVCTTASGGDTDQDGLLDSVETNTGKFVSTANTGTDPNDADTDDDGISDGDETLGTSAGLNLPAMGASPVHKNIFLEYDWFVDALECASHSHRPTPQSISLVSAAFANAPVRNPDGTTGVTLINDYGQGGAFTGGNLINDADGVLTGGVNDTEYVNYKTANFAANRSGYFHYVILPHQYNTNSYSSGQAQVVGDSLIVSLYCANSDQNVANTIMHELGHNLGLLHGGNEYTNYKPNYNSVMNYEYQFPGVDTDCQRGGDGLLDYSRNKRITLNESALIESAGMCGNVAIDWNLNGQTDANAVSADINSDGMTSILSDNDDWSTLVYKWRSNFAGRAVATKVIDCNNPAPRR
ncbi:MAG: hypothetical protein QM784_05420 [Polyangiaceae bacterium]